MKRVLCFVITFVITLLPLSVLADATATEAPAEESKPATYTTANMFDAPADELLTSLTNGMFGYTWPLSNGLSFTVMSVKTYSMTETFTKNIPGYSFIYTPIGTANYLGIPLKTITGTVLPESYEAATLHDCHLFYLCYDLDVAQYSNGTSIFEALVANITKTAGEPGVSADDYGGYSQRIWAVKNNCCIMISAKTGKQDGQLESLKMQFCRYDAPDKVTELLDASASQIIEGLK